MEKTKDFEIKSIGNQQWDRRNSDASSTSSSSEDVVDYDVIHAGSIRRRRSSLIDQFRDFLSRSVDFTFKIDDPFEKEMY